MPGRLYRIDKTALVAKILLGLSIAFLAFLMIFDLYTLEDKGPPFFLILFLLLIYAPLLVFGPSLSLLLFLLRRYRKPKHEDGFLHLSVATLLIHIGRIVLQPYILYECLSLSIYLVCQPLLSLLWIVWRWVKPPVWVLRILHALPLFLLIEPFQCLPSFAILITEGIYCIACTLILPKTVHMKETDIYWIEL